jgi:glycosyltransferase involved in cell wall biosynthesis
LKLPKIQPGICSINNVAPHYREALFALMDRELKCDFYIGDRVATPIVPMNVEVLKGYRKTLTFVPLPGHFYWQKGAVGVAFDAYQYYLVDGEPYCLSNWLVLLITKLRRKKVWLWSHGWYGDENLLKRVVKKVFFKLSDKVLLYGDYARNLMIARGFDPQKVVCIYNSMDYDQQVKIRASLSDATIYPTHFNNDDPVLIYIGRIQKEKMVDQLIRALRELNDRGTPCNLVIIGEEIEETGMRSIVSDYSLNDRVWFVGPLFDEERLGEFIYHADVCVSPGNVGLTAIHCLTYGTPVITHDHFPHQGPEFETITPGATGDFFAENSIDDLCLKIKPWLSLSPEKRASTRQACYATIAGKYNPRYQVAVLKTLLTGG